MISLKNKKLMRGIGGVVTMAMLAPMVLVSSITAKAAGAPSVESHTEAEIRTFISQHPVTYLDTMVEKDNLSAYFDEIPSENSPYAPGKVKDIYLQDALNAVNQVRYIAGVNANVTLDDTYNTYEQAGSMLTAHYGVLNHTPDKPDDMDQTLFDTAYKGTSEGNLGYTWHSMTYNGVTTESYNSLSYNVIYGWMSDGYYTTADFASFNEATGVYTLKEGVPTTSLLGGTIGIRPGAMKLKDLNGDGVVDAKDITVIGDTNPDFAGGFGFSGEVYDFDFNVNFTYKVGNDIYNANKIQTSSRYRAGTYPNMRADMSQSNAYSYINPETGVLLRTLEDLAYWNEGGNGQGAKAMWSPFSTGDAVVVPTDWAMDRASFLRLQSLTIGYTIPKNITKKFGVQRLRAYATGTNLFVISSYPGFDPEVSSYARNSSYSGLTPGIDFSSYPKSRAFTFGFNVTL